MSICTRGISNAGLICTAGLGREQYEITPPEIVGGYSYVAAPIEFKDSPDEWMLIIISQLIAAHQVH